MSGKGFLLLGALDAFVGVALGAFGAHGLRGRLSAEMLRVWETGVHYQQIHALGLLAIGVVVLMRGGRWLALAGWLMFSGMVLFSGSLYVLALTGVRWWGAVTPVGGLLLLAAWLAFAWGVWRS